MSSARWRAAARRRLHSLLMVGWIGSSALSAAAQEAAPPDAPAPPPNTPRDARFEWDTARRWLFVTLAFRDVADAGVLRKLKLGLPTTIVLTGILYAQGSDQPLASTLQNCKITWHVWEEMYRVEVSRPDQPALRQWSPTLNGVLRRCAQTERLPVAHVSQLPDERPLVLRVKVLVNPVSQELLQKIQSWISRPSSATSATTGSILFSTFTGLFMTQIGEADRVLEFSTRPFLPK